MSLCLTCRLDVGTEGLTMPAVVAQFDGSLAELILQGAVSVHPWCWAAVCADPPDTQPWDGGWVYRGVHEEGLL